MRRRPFRCCAVRVCLTRLLAHVYVQGQVWGTRAEVLVAVGQERRQRVHPVRLLHHRHLVGLLMKHNGTKLIRLLINWSGFLHFSQLQVRPHLLKRSRFHSTDM